MDIGVLELCGIVVTVSTAVGVPVAIVKWCGAYVTGRVGEEAADRAAAIIHLDQSIAAGTLASATKINDLDTRISQTIGHKVNNHASRLDALERARQSDIERIVKVESSIAAIDKSLERVEHGQEKLAVTINDRFDTLSAAIRLGRGATQLP
ncbi:hypothetical protein VH567_07785 [Sphingomonas sp. 4RDLI-65]|uniref:hypothetical protein n=1 Tax=Sphingomonas sp. 4RDLI-65 TaxID=3111641 RepID=UPI003C20152E